MRCWECGPGAKKTTTCHVLLVDISCDVQTVVLGVMWRCHSEYLRKQYEVNHDGWVAYLQLAIAATSSDLVGVRQFMHWTSLQAYQMQIFVNNSVEGRQWNTCSTSHRLLWVSGLRIISCTSSMTSGTQVVCGRLILERRSTSPVALIFLSKVFKRVKVHSLLGNILTTSLCRTVSAVLELLLRVREQHSTQLSW